MILTLWCGHTDRSRVYANRLRDVLRTHFPKEGSAAAAMKITPPQMSRQLAGVESFSLWRFAELPDAVQDAFHQACIEARGGHVLWRADLELIHGFYQMPRRQMLKMLPPARAEKVSA